MYREPSHSCCHQPVSTCHAMSRCLCCNSSSKQSHLADTVTSDSRELTKILIEMITELKSFIIRCSAKCCQCESSTIPSNSRLEESVLPSSNNHSEEQATIGDDISQTNQQFLQPPLNQNLDMSTTSIESHMSFFDAQALN